MKTAKLLLVGLCGLVFSAAASTKTLSYKCAITLNNGEQTVIELTSKANLMKDTSSLIGKQHGGQDQKLHAISQVSECVLEGKEFSRLKDQQLDSKTPR
ncbi:TapY2 family type IVa secretion system protein [Dongshaea marina]|uniref:TapY2 family type IVa secretion system protein n=1 Tax=Dongshaea marina TaxID=2047966 RepID=UPI000D3EB86F|nr:TapY2 family type IVa secretion system protein [Dongshaea marina]